MIIVLVILRSTVTYNRQLRVKLAFIFGLVQTLVIPSGFGGSRIRLNCGYTLLPFRCFLAINLSYIPNISRIDNTCFDFFDLKSKVILPKSKLILSSNESKMTAFGLSIFKLNKKPIIVSGQSISIILTLPIFI
jgi:hypothetical protein